MKKSVAIFLTIVMILGLFPSVFANSQPQYVKVNIDGKTVSVRKVDVLFDGQPIESDVPSILYQERTLVPVRFIANYLNAEVEWKQETNEAIIRTADKEIILKINSSDVIVNGETQKIPYNVPAKLVNDARTMVPLRFVSEILGFKVDWDEANWIGLINYNTQEIRGISVNSDNTYIPKIILDTTDMVSYQAMYLTNPYRLVIDITNSKLNVTDKSIADSSGLVSINVDKYPIQNIRASQFSKGPDVTRIVVDLEEFWGYDIKPSSDGKKLEISFVNKLKGITLENIDGRKGIVIDNTNLPRYNILRLSNPDRIVLDVLDSALEDPNATFNIMTEYIKAVRTSQFKPDGMYNKDDKIVIPQITVGKEDGVMYFEGTGGNYKITPVL